MNRQKSPKLTVVSPCSNIVEIAIGINLGDAWGHFCHLDEQREIVEEGRFRTTADGIEKRFADLAPVRIAMEAGTLSIRVSEQLKEYYHEVIVANLLGLRAISRTLASITSWPVPRSFCVVFPHAG
jgi:hypothetical protein